MKAGTLGGLQLGSFKSPELLSLQACYEIAFMSPYSKTVVGIRRAEEEASPTT